MIALVLGACGPNKELLRETKFDPVLLERVESVERARSVETLLISGVCVGSIDGLMRRDLVGAGVDVQEMSQERFVGRVSSNDAYCVAALDCVIRLALVGEMRR